MSKRSEVLDLLNGKNTGRVPWFGDLSWYYDSLIRRGMLHDKYFGPKGEANLYNDLGVGIYLYTPAVFETNYPENIRHTHEASDKEIVQLFETPVGSIKEVMTYSKSTWCYAYSKHFVEDINDFRVMRYVHEHARYSANYQGYIDRVKIWGDDGIGFAMGIASMAPLHKLIARWAGIETTMNLLCDYPDEIEEGITQIENSQRELITILSHCPAEVVIFPENLSSDIIGEKLFLKYDMPYYQKTTSILHSAGKKVAIHIDGRLNPCLGYLSEAGFDIADAVTPEPFGDVPISKLREVAGDKLIIWGGLPGSMFSPVYPDQMFHDHLVELLNHVDDKFVIGVADQVPPDAKAERIAHVREVIDRYIK